MSAVKLLCKMARGARRLLIIDLPEPGGADELRKLDVPVRMLIAFEGH